MQFAAHGACRREIQAIGHLCSLQTHGACRKEIQAIGHLCSSQAHGACRREIQVALRTKAARGLYQLVASGAQIMCTKHASAQITLAVGQVYKPLTSEAYISHPKEACINWKSRI